MRELDLILIGAVVSEKSQTRAPPVRTTRDGFKRGASNRETREEDKGVVNTSRKEPSNQPMNRILSTYQTPNTTRSTGWAGLSPSGAVTLSAFSNNR